MYGLVIEKSKGRGKTGKYSNEILKTSLKLLIAFDPTSIPVHVLPDYGGLFEILIPTFIKTNLLMTKVKKLRGPR